MAESPDPFWAAVELHWARGFGPSEEASAEAAWQCLRRTLGPGGPLLHSYSLISVSDLQSQQRVACCSHLTWSSEEFNKWVRQNEGILPNERILQRTHLILFGYLTNERLGEKDRWVDGSLYVRDNTGIMPCELLHFKLDWLGRLLLFPSWIFIPQGDKGTAGYVEILEDPIPVIPGPEKTVNIVPIFYPGPAAQLLSARAQCKRLEKLNLAGELLRLSNILHIHHKTFFFLFLKCFSSAAYVPVLVQEAHHLVWQHALQLGHKYVLTDLKISCLKASEMKILVTSSSSQLLPYCTEQVKEQFLDSSTEGSPVVSVLCMSNVQPNRILEVKEEEKMLVPHRKSKMMSYTGIITHVLNAQAGLFELDNKFTLCLAYQQLQNFGRGLRPGARIELQDVHLVQKAVATSPSVLGACLRSTVVLKSFSAYSVLHQPITYRGNLYVRLLLYYNLSLPFYLWLVNLLETFKQRFCYFIPHHQALDAAEKFIVPILESLVMPRKQERNTHLEILAESHHCPIEQCQILEPPCQIPSFSLLYPMVEKQCWESSSPSPQLSSSSEIHNRSAQEVNHRLAWSCCSLSAENFQPHMMLLGVLGCSRRGYLQLQDKHKALPCVIFHRDGRPFAETSLIGCLLQVEIFQLITEQFLQCNFPPWQQLETPKYVKDKKTRLYVQFFFEDAKILHTPEKRVIKDPKLPEKRKTVRPRACESSSSGVKGNDTSTAEHRSSEDLNVGKAKPEASIPEHSENSAGKYSSVSRLFLVTQKEGLAQRNYLPSSESKGEDKQAAQVCFQAMVLWMSKPELCTSLEESGRHMISAPEKTNEGQQNVLLLFQRKSLHWFPFLHPGHMYRLIIPGCSDLNVFDKPSFSLAPSSLLNSLNCSLFLRIPDGALLDHVNQISQLVSPVMEQKLFSIDEILSPRFTGSLVSFSGEVVEKHLCQFPAGRQSRTNAQHKANRLSLDYTVKLSILPAAASPIGLDVYIEAPFLPYLWGVLPGARILFSGLQRKISRFGNVYCTYIASSCVRILTPPPNNLSSRHLGSTSVLSGVYLYNVALQPPSLCQIEATCHLTCVLFMSLQWTCSVCSSTFIEGRCSQNHPPCLSHTGVTKASAKILVEDGTSAFVVLCKDQQVQKVLSLNPKEWDIIQRHVQSKGSVYVQPSNASSGPRRTEEPEDILTSYLTSLCRSPVVCRTIRLTFQLDKKFSKVQEAGPRQLRRFFSNELEFLSHTRTESNLVCLNIQEAT
ncbi:CST complex subunit CTC1 [Sceloporus undulatus]|uniref:CST complex subunit CTC1 n=1 Tax=Sceloporus undulatus TaxID=8520 RepID=UPI001C4DC657|nr:CST complex subunit CTC1 [Sceloporus undulatus]